MALLGLKDKKISPKTNTMRLVILKRLNMELPRLE